VVEEQHVTQTLLESGEVITSPAPDNQSAEAGAARRMAHHVAEALNNIPAFLRRTPAEATPITAADTSALFDHAVNMLLPLVTKSSSTFAGTCIRLWTCKRLPTCWR
jgi:hypothetical protein